MKYGPACALVGALLFTSFLAWGQAQESPATEEAAPTEVAVPAQRVYLDPATGRLLEEPPSGVEVVTLSPAELNMLSTSDEGLVERPLPGGGSMVDLKGRFRHMLVATVAEDGSIEIREVAAALPAASEHTPKEDQEKEK